ncbi:origin of replication complex subunit 6-like [Chenopodium quinoa]|uniref:Origin of replication complex subunit 6 n=1 Tax=Chenopodium quinoa TaxID=63459 RepID=A0A803L1M9_CHEQI|nr:origin of replication complex subunit 6-like [Chenopodium quinoa]
MDITDIAKKLDLAGNKPVVRKAAEFRRLSDVKFDSSALGIGEICKAIICLEIAANKYEVIFDRQNAIKLSGMSEKAYTRSFNSLQNVLDVKNNLDVRELAIQFGCVRIIPFVQKGLKMYKARFFASLPASRRSSTDFSRPVFMAVAFYLCAKKHKLKADKVKLIELCGTSESEFSSVSNSMKDLCHDVFGVLKEKKDPKEVKGNRELLDAFPEKRGYDDGGYTSDEDSEPSSYKKRKRMEKHDYEEWKSTVVSSINQKKDKEVTTKRTKQARLNFPTIARDTQDLKVT